MSGDYSRSRFDPLADFSAVLMQQGRVQLDADWNELVELTDRRLRAAALDTLSSGPRTGIQGFAVVPRQTPEAFEIQATGGHLTIGRGRMYVDGIVAENHGGGAAELDPQLAEVRGAELRLRFEDQPFPPRAVELQAGPHLVYLDVWRREVTPLERPELLEIAVGVDTTTRLQTAWQVRILADVGNGVTRDTPDANIPGWLGVIAPSAGRLTSKAIEGARDDDPCELPPGARYRGLENQLYRVEIHDGGGLGVATFKWSRDNASVAAAVTEVLSAKELKLSSLGRDAVLRFNTDDWVEIIDDLRETSGTPTDPDHRRGEIRKVTVDDAKQTLRFDPPLPGDLIPSGGDGDTAADRHLRVRRWDQSGKVRDSAAHVVFDLDASTSAGVIPVPTAGTLLTLENGVQVSFSLADPDGRFRAGDYWLFAARTADGSVEQLVDAPPRGVHHHYARLALVTLPDAETDLRDFWPPEISAGESCACSVCVTPESHAQRTLTVQMAIDKLKESGGTVCLGAGTYLLDESPLSIDGAQSIRIRGQGTKTIIAAPGAAMRIADSNDVVVEELAISSVARTEQPIVTIANAVRVRLQRTLICAADTNLHVQPAAIGLAGLLIDTEIRDNVIAASTGISRAVSRKGQEVGYLSTVLLEIAGNVFQCRRRGVSLDDLTFHLGAARVCDNTLVECADVALGLAGASAQGFGVDVIGNTLWVAGDAIVAAGDSLRIEGNDIRSVADRKISGRRGIVLGAGTESRRPSSVGSCHILSNRISNLEDAAIVVAIPVASLLIKQNVVAGTVNGIVFEERGAANAVSIENNQLFEIASQVRAEDAFIAAIRVAHADVAQIIGNVVRGLGSSAIPALARVGIQAVACGDIRIDGNELTDIGPAGEYLNETAAIDVVSSFSSFAASGNRLRRGGAAAEQSARPNWYGILAVPLDRSGPRRLASGLSIVPLDEGAAVFLTPLRAFSFPRGTEQVAIHANAVQAMSSSELIVAAAQGDCQLSENRCEQLKPDRQVVVSLGAGTLIASGNRLLMRNSEVKDPVAFFSVSRGRATVLGNIVNGTIFLDGNPLTGPWAALNVTL